MAEIKKVKQKMSFNKLLLIFGGSFFGLIIMGVLIASMLVNKSDKKVSQPMANQQINNQTDQLPSDLNQVNQIRGQVGQADITAYMAERDSERSMEALSKQLETLSAQQQAILGQVNASNNNVLQQLQKMNADLILLDQRITNLEKAMKPDQQVSGKSKSDTWIQQRRHKEKMLNSNLIQAASNQRIWLAGNQTESYQVGDQFGKQKVVYVDDVQQKVYVN